MKILLIRHGEVSMQWEQRYTPEEFNKACRLYDEADIRPVDHPQETGDYERIYVSSLKRSIQTAHQMFPSAPDSMFVQTPLLDEVPLCAYTNNDDRKQHAKWVYDVRGRLQWRFGRRQEDGNTGRPESRPENGQESRPVNKQENRHASKQDETYSETCARADELIDLLEQKNENAILISHGMFMEVLLRRLKKRRRYEFYRASTFKIAPLEKIKVTDKQPHCGGCHHNCLLSQAGCMIGQDKARKAGILN